MKQNMPSYACVLSNGDYDILEEIFEDKFFEFIECYWLLREYTNYITMMKYKKNKSCDRLSIDVTLDKLKTEDVITSLKNKIPKGKKVDIRTKKDVISISFYSN